MQKTEHWPLLPVVLSQGSKESIPSPFTFYFLVEMLGVDSSSAGVLNMGVQTQKGAMEIFQGGHREIDTFLEPVSLRPCLLVTCFYLILERITIQIECKTPSN